MFKNIFSKVIVCPNCGQRSRVPVKPGKVLLITCPGCQNKFEIKFENPLDAFKSKAGSESKFMGFKGLLHQYYQLPTRSRWLMIGMIVMFIMSLRSCKEPMSPRQIYKKPIVPQTPVEPIQPLLDI